MKNFLFTALAFYGFTALSMAQVKNNSAGKKYINVEINPNMELLGFAYFLGYQGKEIELHDQSFDINGKKTNGKEWFALGWHLYNQYKPFAQSKNLETVMGFANKIWLDYLIALLIQLDNCPKAKLTDNIPLKYYIRFSDNKNEQEARTNVILFIDALNRFYKEVHFNKYLSDNKANYDIVFKQIKSGLPDGNFLPAMESFYKHGFNSYYLIPSLTIPTSMGFGVNYEKNGEEVVNNVFGPLWFQHLGDNPDLGFSDTRRIRELSTHEFGHSFVNPVIDSLPQKLIDETRPLFDSIKNVMSEQGYSQWKICLYEHFVRAGEIIISENLGYRMEAENLLKEYIETRRFIYLPIIIKILEDYNKTPDSSYKNSVIKALAEMKKTINPVR